MLIQTFFPDPGKIRHVLMNIAPGFFSEKGSTLPIHNPSVSCAAVIEGFSLSPKSKQTAHTGRHILALLTPHISTCPAEMPAV